MFFSQWSQAACFYCIALSSHPSLPLPYLAVHIATWRKMVRIDHGEELNVCLGETARNILLFGALLTAGILLDKILC